MVRTVACRKRTPRTENRRQRCSDTHKPDKRVSVALAGCGNSRICHPEPASFAGEGSAVRKKAKEKADSSPRQKPTGVRNDKFSTFSVPYSVVPQNAAAEHRL